MKKFILGVATGLMLSLAIPAGAEIAEYILVKVKYPIIVNDAMYLDEKLPVLNYQGSTYVPLRNMGDLLGADVQWNSDKKQVEIKGVDAVSAATD